MLHKQFSEQKQRIPTLYSNTMFLIKHFCKKIEVTFTHMSCADLIKLLILIFQGQLVAEHDSLW